MSFKPFIPKVDPELPDSYGLVVHFHDGKELQLDIVTHKIVDIVFANSMDPSQPSKLVGASNSPFMEYVTKDDIIGGIPINSIKYWEFDRRFTKVAEISRKSSEKNIVQPQSELTENEHVA